MVIQFHSKGDTRYRFLSNFHECLLVDPEFPEFVFHSVEAYFQFMKFAKRLPREEVNRIASRFAGPDVKPNQAKARGGKGRAGIRMTKDETDEWNAGRRVEVMRKALRMKFADEGLRQALLATGDAELVESVPGRFGDIFWGTRGTPAKGTNMLGRLLMEERGRRNE